MKIQYSINAQIKSFNGDKNKNRQEKVSWNVYRQRTFLSNKQSKEMIIPTFNPIKDFCPNKHSDLRIQDYTLIGKRSRSKKTGKKD